MMRRQTVCAPYRPTAKLALRAALGLTVGLGIAAAPRQVLAQDDAQKAPAAPPAIHRSVSDDGAIDPRQPLKPDFIISVTVAGESEPSGNYTVDAAGNVAIRYAGISTPVTVKDLTPAQAAVAIQRFLQTYIRNPEVTVTIVNVPRPVVFVNGAVQIPGPIYVTPDTTLVDVLSKVEWSDNADLTQVRLTRREMLDGQTQLVTRVIHFDRYIKAEPGQPLDESQNPALRDKDRILVPPKSLPGVATRQISGVVSVGGEVLHPQQNIPLRTDPPMTVREAINLVGGTDDIANRREVTIRRASLDRPLVIDLDKAEQGDLVNNIELRPDDAIYVERLENNSYIELDGGFVKPGKFVYDKRTTLLQAIAEAGGVAPYSKAKQGRIFRHPDNDPKHTRVLAFNWNEIYSGKEPDVQLEPGDAIFVPPGGPAKTFGPFDVLGGLGNAALVYNTFAGRWIP